MNIIAINPNIIQKKKIAFKAGSFELTGDNLEDFLKNKNIDLQKTYDDLIEIKQSELKEKKELFVLKRMQNTSKELSLNGNNYSEDFFRSFDDTAIIRTIRESQDKECLGLINKIADESEVNKINYKKKVSTFAKEVENADFVNTIKIFEINRDISEKDFAKNTIEGIRKIFFEYKDNDTILMKKSNTAFIETSRNYLEFIAQSFKDIKDLHAGAKKWEERIPGFGLAPRIGRVANQQECAKYLYDTHNAFCNQYVHNGIRTIAVAYKEKIIQTQSYIDFASPYLNYQENEYVNAALTNMKKLAIPELERYKKILSYFADKSLNIASVYKHINNSGDISSLTKLIRTILPIC